MITTHKENERVGTSRFPSVFGPRDEGTPNGGINWDLPYPNSGRPRRALVSRRDRYWTGGRSTG